MNVWFDISLDAKVDYQYFLMENNRLITGRETVEGKLFVKNSSSITADELASCLPVPDDSVKSLKVTKIF